LKSWSWITSHPAVGQTDPYYQDADPSQEVRWAKAEIFCLTGDAGLEKQLHTEINAEPFQPPSWRKPQALGYFSLFFDAKTNTALKALIEKKLKDYCDSLVLLAGQSGYGVATAPSDYHWGSNEALMHRANCLLFCSLVTGKEKYMKLALNQLDYLLGTNSLDKSFIAGFGKNLNSQPYHWTMAAYKKLMPGWASGGPNGDPSNADPLLVAMINCGLPPAKCWLDMCEPTGSWASNEGETSENAALVFLCGFFSTQ
jgi:endoglucanase